MQTRFVNVTLFHSTRGDFELLVTLDEKTGGHSFLLVIDDLNGDRGPPRRYGTPKNWKT